MNFNFATDSETGVGSVNLLEHLFCFVFGFGSLCFEGLGLHLQHSNAIRLHVRDTFLA